MSDTIPTADFVRVHGHTAVVACPYCHRHHEHPRTERGGHEWRVAGCSMYLPPDVRARGYRFTVPGAASRGADPTTEGNRP